MNSIEWNHGYRACPRIVQEYFVNAASGEQEDRAQELLALDADAWDRVSDPAWRLIFQGTPQQEFREAIKNVSGAHDPNEVERILLQYLVYPVADLVSWDVEARLQELGIAPAQLQSMFRISLRPLAYGAAARRIATNARLSVLTEDVARRLREILVSYLKGVRSLDQVREALQQTQVEGGVGFSLEQATRYVEELEKLQNAVRILSEQEYAAWYTNFQRDANARLFEESSATTKAANASSVSEKNEDGVLIVRDHPDGDTYDQLLETAIEETVQQLSVAGLDDYLMKRLRNIISTRLRDVRNQIQVKEVLVRDSKIGGLDRHPDEAEAMSRVIEAAYASHHEALGTAERQRIERMRQAQEQKRDVRRKEESASHAEWYRQKVQDANPWAAAMATQTPGGAPSVQTQGVGADGFGRASVDSIRPPTRLTSLANELGGITLAEFRRIAKSPEEAMERLWQKLETLKQQSYEEWQGGAQAWRQSPLQQQYLQLVTQSFSSGHPVAEIAREWHEKDPNQPTPEEIGAILLMNNRLNV